MVERFGELPVLGLSSAVEDGTVAVAVVEVEVVVVVEGVVVLGVVVVASVVERRDAVGYTAWVGLVDMTSVEVVRAVDKHPSWVVVAGFGGCQPDFEGEDSLCHGGVGLVCFERHYQWSHC